MSPSDLSDSTTATDTIAVADLTDLPKVSLHDHLDGGLRPETILELAAAVGHDLPASDPAALADWFATSADSGDLPTYLSTFDHTVAVMQSAEGLERVARECVVDLAAEGVIWAEVRWAPEQHLSAGLTLDETVEAVQRGLEDGIGEAKAHGHDIRTGQLVTAMRHADRGLEIAELAVRHRDRGVVGFDIAGAESGFPPSRLRTAFDLLAAEFFPVTVHAGEADGLESIRSALLDGRALRLGHGVRIVEDIVTDSADADNVYVTLGRLAQWVKDRSICLETSPSSNLQTGAVTGKEMADHPLDLLYQLGFRVTVNTDNRLMSRTTLSRELALIQAAFGYELDDLENFQLNAVEAAFLPLEEREELAARIVAGFDAASR